MRSHDRERGYELWIGMLPSFPFMFPGQESYLSGIVSSTKFCKPIVSNFSSIEKNSYAINFERTNCNMLGWILGSFQIYLSHFNHSPLRYSWVDNLIFRSKWNLEMLIFDEREKRRRKTKNNNFILKPQLASMARLKFIDHWREASVSYHCAIRKLLRSRSFLGSLVVSES